MSHNPLLSFCQFDWVKGQNLIQQGMETSAIWVFTS